ncbi:YdcF family protein [Paenibacillus sp. YYML68]|uniref:YdcF family protein n=1 Tax=Paenibacillus sp. YYML68 TaxID=2909250 RepID=UPI00248FAB84|nr:YdcF family protein [Paenibacillus sp. YYML68]
MIYMLKMLYSFLLPPGLFVLLLLALGMWCWARLNRKAGIAVLVAAVLLYGSSISLVTDPLVRSLENRYSPPAPGKLTGDVYVVLGGGAIDGVPHPDGVGQLTGHTLQRVVAAARLYAEKPLPIIVSGGQVYANSGNEGQLAKRTLLSLGVPEASIKLEDRSRTTEENAEFTKVLLDQHGYTRPILITSAFHMARAMKHFEANGIAVLPYPVDYKASPASLPRTFQQTWTPRSAAMDDLSLVLKEYLGLLQ